jgi:hypothetical protein
MAVCLCSITTPAEVYMNNSNDVYSNKTSRRIGMKIYTVNNEIAIALFQ